MKYLESNLDRTLRNWFIKDNTCALLREISLRMGAMRGLTAFDLEFTYPITAISGKNGSGKSTILALACCAYHNDKPFPLFIKKVRPYYTFADFFIQHAEDIPAEGIIIRYKIAFNNWRKSQTLPTGVGVGIQFRKKMKGGKWNDYAGRVDRHVVFLGIDRIVPHGEKSQSKSYSRAFSQITNYGWESDVKDLVGYILGKRYEDFKYTNHSKYRLPIVRSNGNTYSGFHMGAGENALFELFSIMHAMPIGSLIVVDEIELGLHAEAQTRLMIKLKELCKSRKLQIICTTHSKEIFSELPDDARVFIDNINGKASLSKGISSDFAFSKLSFKNSVELHVLVEDDVAKAVITSYLPSDIRARITIEVIGSASALSRQLASNSAREKKDNILIVFDGDQKKCEGDNLKLSYRLSTSQNETDYLEWCRERIAYLPSDTWPEKWIIENTINNLDTLAHWVGSTADQLNDACNIGLQADKHKELYEVGIQIELSESEALRLLCLNLAQTKPDELNGVISKIKSLLD
ncbi:ATP-dependent nuclease [Aeromonas caviae]